MVHVRLAAYLHDNYYANMDAIYCFLSACTHKHTHHRGSSHNAPRDVVSWRKQYFIAS